MRVNFGSCCSRSFQFVWQHSIISSKYASSPSGPGDARIGDQQTADFDSLAVDQLRRAHGDLQIGIARRQLGLNADANFVVQPGVEIESQPDRRHQSGEQSPFESEPAGVHKIAHLLSESFRLAMRWAHLSVLVCTVCARRRRHARGVR